MTQTLIYFRLQARLPEKVLMRQQYGSDSHIQLEKDKTIKLEVSQNEKEKAGNFMEELTSFFKINKNNVERAQQFLIKHLGKEKVTK